MKKSFFSAAILFAFFLIVLSPAARLSAQQKQPDEVVKAPNVFEVRLPTTVVDKKKQPVTGLSQTDFIILENNEPQEITFFSDDKNSPPLYVGVLMDTSPSTAPKIKFSKEAAKSFVYAITRERKDKAAFLTFDHEIKLRQDFTEKLGLLDKAIENVNETGQNTSLFDAVYQFCNQNLSLARGRRVIVVITDGEDTFSRADIKDAIDMAQRTETIVFAISTKGGFSGTVPGVEAGTVKDSGDKDLERLAVETGGEAFFTGDVTTLENAFSRIAKDLRSQYVITYKPTNQNYDGALRKIEVRLADKYKKGNYKIRTKKGYRAVRGLGLAVNS